MTIQQALDRKSIIDKDSFPDELKIAWLSELDAQLYIELIQTHENPDNIKFKPYTKDDGENNLLVPFPYDKLYIPFLFAKVAEAYAETEDYNNHLASFEKAMREFRGYWNRKYMPLSGIPKKEKFNGIMFVYGTTDPLEDKK